MPEYKGKYVMGVGAEPWKCDCHNPLEKERPPESEGETNTCTVCKEVWTAQFLHSDEPLSFMKAYDVVESDAVKTLCWFRAEKVEETKPRWIN